MKYQFTMPIIVDRKLEKLLKICIWEQLKAVPMHKLSENVVCSKNKEA